MSPFFAQERLTEIEKEEGEGDKKEDVDDPEEEDPTGHGTCHGTVVCMVQEAKKQKEKEEEEEKNRNSENFQK